MIKCPYCEKKIRIGCVDITGTSYKCINCKVWFKEIDGKLIKREYIKI